MNQEEDNKHVQAFKKNKYKCERQHSEPLQRNTGSSLDRSGLSWTRQACRARGMYRVILVQFYNLTRVHISNSHQSLVLTISSIYNYEDLRFCEACQITK